MDFSAWFEAYLGGRWWTFDARNNEPRIGRVLMATGRDAADVAMTTSFGRADLRSFFVVTEEETAARPEEVCATNTDCTWTLNPSTDVCAEWSFKKESG
jgi:transglutaminase-like putative cysteine protease